MLLLVPVMLVPTCGGIIWYVVELVAVVVVVVVK